MMKLLIVVALAALCAVVQGSDASVLTNKALLEDIETAKSDLQMLSSTARMVTGQELMVLQYMNDWGQYDVNQLYGKLLTAEISEADVQDLRNKSDTQVHATSVNILDSAQNPRDLCAASSLSWFHLDMFNLNILAGDITVIKAEERAVWFEIIALENQLEDQQKQFQANVDALTVGLSPSELTDINMILANMKMRVENDINNLRMQRVQLVDYTNIAVAALQKILDQIPQSKLKL